MHVFKMECTEGETRLYVGQGIGGQRGYVNIDGWDQVRATHLSHQTEPTPVPLAMHSRMSAQVIGRPPMVKYLKSMLDRVNMREEPGHN